MPLTPLFLQLTAVNTAIFQLNAVDAAVFTVNGRSRPYFSGKTQLVPLYLHLNAVNALFSSKPQLMQLFSS